MTTIDKKQGDVKDTIVVTLNGIESLADVASVEAHVKTNLAPATVATLAATVLDADACTIVVQCGDTGSGWLPAARVAEWDLEYQVTFSNGAVITWPAGVPDVVRVNAQLG